MGNQLSFPFSFTWCLYPSGYPLANLFFEHGFDNFQELVVFWGRTVVSTFHRTKIKGVYLMGPQEGHFSISIELQVS